MEISTLLRDVRHKAALTQIELAQRAGVSQSTVSAVERGSRRPSSTVTDRLFAAVGLRLRLATEPAEQPEADLEAAIDAMLVVAPAERLRAPRFDGLALLRLLAPAAPVVEKAAGAVLHGAPVPVAVLDIAVERDRLGDLAEVIRRSFAERWSEVWKRFGMEAADPRAPGPMRWSTLDGEFRVRVVDERMDPVTVVVDDLPVRVRPLHEIEAAEPQVRRALELLRRRTAAPA